MKTAKYAFVRTLPVMAGYLVLGLGFGVLLQTKGYGLGWALAMSTLVYAGSMQYLAVDLLAGGASLVSAALMTLMVNARHLFYGVSMLERYLDTGPAKPYLIFALTDETYSLVCSGEAPEGSTQSSDQSGLPVPDVKNKTEAEARATLTRSGFEVTVQQGESDTVPEGSVISQSPEGGSRAASGSTIVLVISSGPSSELVSVPDVRGQDIDTAVAILVERGLVQGTITYVNNEDPNLTDKVCEQSYSVGTMVAAGTKIDLSVSQGPKVTYALTGEIESPALENPDYKAGTPCQVVVTTASGKEIFSTMTETFPVKVNIGGIEDATGVITFGYSVTGETTTQVDPATGETISIPGESKLTSSQRVIEFTIEEEVQP